MLKMNCVIVEIKLLGIQNNGRESFFKIFWVFENQESEIIIRVGSFDKG